MKTAVKRTAFVVFVPTVCLFMYYVGVIIFQTCQELATGLDHAAYGNLIVMIPREIVPGMSLGFLLLITTWVLISLHRDLWKPMPGEGQQ